MIRKCFLHCIKNLHNPIALPHLEEVIVGRSRETDISDPNCSRKQLSIKADCEKCCVWIKQLGVNASGINGFSIQRNESIPVEDLAYIELLLEQHVHIVKFDPPVRKEIKEVLKETNSNLKRKALHCSNDEKSCNKKQKLISNQPEISKESKSKQELLEMKNILPTSEESLEKIDDLLYIYTSKGVLSRNKIASYDLDGTLIKTKSGLVFAKNVDDWQLAFPEVPGKLKQYYNTGYKIVIFTNQAGVGNGKLKIENFRTKLENIIKRIGVPIQAFISTGKGFYRKPCTGMWDTLSQMKNDDVEINMESSFYCGDAAGRKKDHSLADRLFAENINIHFCTPENHFGGASEAPHSRPVFEPKHLDKTLKKQSLVADKQEVLVMVGFPGSGKSSIAKQIETHSKKRYRIVCRDSLGSWQRCMSEATKHLQNGKSVIVDSTNPDIESRARWISLASSNKITCRCLSLDVSFQHSQHNNRFRQLTDALHVYVGDMIFHTYKKKFIEPTTTEGFSEVVKVKFIPQFDSDEKEALYYKYLLEK